MGRIVPWKDAERTSLSAVACFRELAATSSNQGYAFDRTGKVACTCGFSNPRLAGEPKIA